MEAEPSNIAVRRRAIDRSLLLYTLGFALLWPFLRRSFYGVTFAGFPDPQTCYIAFLVVASSVSVIAFALRKRLTLLLHARPAIMVVAQSAFSVFMVASLLLPGETSVRELGGIAAAALLGTAFPLLVVMWGQASLALAAKRRLPVLRAVTIAFILGFAISTATVPLETGASYLFVCFPALSSACWLACHRKRQLPGCKIAKIRSLPLARLLVLGAFLLLISLLRGPFYTGSIDYVPGWDVVAPNLLSVLMAALTLAFLTFNKSTKQAFRYAIVAFALLLLAGLLLAIYGDVAAASLHLIIVGKSCFELFLWLLLVDSACGLRISSATIFVPFFLAFELLASAVSYLVSPLFVTIFSLSFDRVIPAFSLVTALVFVAGCFLYLNFEAGSRSATPSPEPSEAQTAQSLEMRLESVEGYQDLTPREQEIALLLAQGNSYKRIAEMLFVSPSTVQTHAKSLYRKLAIHSKQELVDHLQNN